MGSALDGLISMLTGNIPADSEIAPVTKSEVEPALQKALEAAQDTLLALHEGHEGIGQKIATAKRRDNKRDFERLTQRLAELPDAIYAADVALLRAEQTILDAQFPALREAVQAGTAATATAEQAVMVAQTSLRIAQRRAQIFGTRTDANRNRRGALDQQIEQLREARFVA